MSEPLTHDEKQNLLRLAREALNCAVDGKALPPLDQTTLTPALREKGASFVTLTIRGRLRGCIGTIEPRQPLVDDVRERTISAALQDYRFPPVEANEVDKIEIEISRLTLPQHLEYDNSDDLLEKLRPHVDGVIIKDEYQRATFLPQVWEKIPDKVKFMNDLCWKMGAPPDIWRQKHLEVLVYQVEEFHE
jgi:AmmeMemoRadiSam system protein A